MASRCSSSNKLPGLQAIRKKAGKEICFPPLKPTSILRELILFLLFQMLFIFSNSIRNVVSTEILDFPDRMQQMTSRKPVDVSIQDPTPRKWRVPMGEDAFKRVLAQGNPGLNKVFGEGSLFSPLLFGKFFDPSDAFPLWEFESDLLLSHLRSSGKSSVDWLQTDRDYALKAELPENGKGSVQVYVENGKILEISGQLKQQRDQSKTKDWTSGQWWEYGFVRRLELPENADWRKMEAFLCNEAILEIKIPKYDTNKGVEEAQNTEAL